MATGTTTITSATAAFTSAIVGNIIYLQGGTGTLAAGPYQVITFTSVTQVVLDRAVATGTGITMNIGGALASFAQLFAVMIQSNKAFVKNDGTYVQTATATTAISGSTAAVATVIQGYTTTRGDGGMATIQLSTNTGLTCLSVGGANFNVSNMIFDCNSLGTSTGLNMGTAGNVYNCIAKNFTTAGINISTSTVQLCEVTAGTSTATAAIISAGANIYDCNIHDNACTGVTASARTVLIKNLITNNTGATSYGFVSTTAAALDVIYGNTIYGNGSHGIYVNATALTARLIQDNSISNNGGFGITGNSNARNWPSVDGNAYYLNTSGTIANFNNTAAQNGVAPYTSVFDKICSTTPYVNAGGGNWNLNQTATGGGLLRSQGVPFTFPNGGSNRNWLDFGAAEHQDPGFAS